MSFPYGITSGITGGDRSVASIPVRVDAVVRGIINPINLYDNPFS